MLWNLIRQSCDVHAIYVHPYHVMYGGGLWTKLTCRNVVSEYAICRMQRCNAVSEYAICRMQRYNAVSGDAICRMQRYNMTYPRAICRIRWCNMPYQRAICRIRWCNMPYAEGNMSYAEIQYVVCRDTICRIRGDAICRMQRAICRMQRAICRMQRAICRIRLYLNFEYW